MNCLYLPSGTSNEGKLPCLILHGSPYDAARKSNYVVKHVSNPSGHNKTIRNPRQVHAQFVFRQTRIAEHVASLRIPICQKIDYQRVRFTFCA